jgi:hypothetical protein
MSATNILRDAESTGSLGDKESLREVLDFLVTEEQLGVTLVSAAIGNAPGTPSEAFLPVLRNGVTTEYHHVQALKQAGGKPLTTKYWFPDAALDNGGIGIFETLETIETIEISLYLIGVSAYARLGEDFGARLCAEAMGTEAVHRALVRFAQGELGNQIGPPNDVGFENFDYPTVSAVREALETLGIGYGVETSQPGRFYEYPGDPIANGVGTPVNHTRPRETHHRAARSVRRAPRTHKALSMRKGTITQDPTAAPGRWFWHAGRRLATGERSTASSAEQGSKRSLQASSYSPEAGS